MKRRQFLKVVAGCAVLSSANLAQGSGMTPEEARALLDLHNAARTEFGAAPLTWSDELAAGAQKWAEYLARTGQFKHDNSPYGENIALAFDVDQTFDMWYQERELYRPGATFSAASMDCGHYTQMVWGRTQRMGCGKAETADGMWIWVARYDPRGNIVGEKP